MATYLSYNSSKEDVLTFLRNAQDIIKQCYDMVPLINDIEGHLQRISYQQDIEHHSDNIEDTTCSSNCLIGAHLEQLLELCEYLDTQLSKN